MKFEVYACPTCGVVALRDPRVPAYGRMQCAGDQVRRRHVALDLVLVAVAEIEVNASSVADAEPAPLPADYHETAQ